jgi:hypothetical protein
MRKSISNLAYILELIDNLLDYPCINESSLAYLWGNIQQFCLGKWYRLNKHQRLIVMELAVEIVSTKSQFPEIDDSEITEIEEHIDLDGKSLAIYSLTENAAVRAKKIISHLYPTLEIQLNHDTNATPALMNLVNKVDYFIFSSRSAKHAAYIPVKNKRKDIIYPVGKGSSSIVSAFVDAI